MTIHWTVWTVLGVAVATVLVLCGLAVLGIIVGFYTGRISFWGNK